jgi:hypothetical protein
MPTPLLFCLIYIRNRIEGMFLRGSNIHYKSPSRLIQQKWIVVVPEGDSTKMQPSIQNGQSSVLSKIKMNSKPL